MSLSKFRFKPIAAPSPEPRRLDFLDGLRGMAALVVVLFHFSLLFLGWTEVLSLIHFLGAFINGHFSVAVFFVLSGFVLAHSSAKKRTPLPLQVILRYFRLTVPMTVALIIGCLFLKFGAMESPNNLRPAPGLGEAIRDGLWHVYRYRDSRITPVVWTMHAEFLGSMVIYLIYRFLAGWPRLVALGVLALIQPFYLGFSLGALLRESYTRRRLHDSPWSWLALAGGGLIATNNAPFDSFRCLTAGAALFVYAVLTIPLLKNVFSGKIPLFLGKISFCLYLLHEPLLGALDAFTSVHLPLPISLRAIILLVFYLIGAISLASLMTLTIDEPLIRLLHHIARKFQISVSLVEGKRDGPLGT